MTVTTGPADPRAVSTRERILRESSDLFARRGYAGTSTRDIAAAVGIRQPSLFHHFASKSAIADHLLEYAVGTTLAQARRIATMEEPASVRLYAFSRWVMVHVVSSPYRVVGLVDYEFLTAPEGEPWQSRIDEITRYIVMMVNDGVKSGEFVQDDPEFLRLMVVGLYNAHHRVQTVRPTGNNEQAASLGADFVVRALLQDNTRLPQIRAEADLLG